MAENARIAIRKLVRLRVRVDWVRALRFWIRSFFSEGVSGFITRDSWRILPWIFSVSDVGDDEAYWCGCWWGGGTTFVIQLSFGASEE